MASPPVDLIQANFHDSTMSAFDFINNIDDTFPDEQHEDVLNNDNDNTLLANVTYIQDSISPTDIRKVLSTSSNNNSLSKITKHTSTDNKNVTIDGIKYRKRNMHKTYNVSIHKHNISSSLVDRGANGGIAASDARCIDTCSDKTVNIMGIDNHQLKSIPLITAGGVSQS